MAVSLSLAVSWEAAERLFSPSYSQQAVVIYVLQLPSDNMGGDAPC